MKKQKHDIKGMLLLFSAMLLFFSGCGNSGGGSGIEEGMQYIISMDYSAALTSFEVAREKGEDERLLTRGLGIAYMGLTDYDAAIENFIACLSLSDGVISDLDYDVNYYLAAAYQKAGRYSEAEAVYNAILELRPADTDAYYLRGNAKLSQGQYLTAKEDFDKVVELEPNNYSRLIQVYEVLLAEGYKVPGQEYLETALSERAAKMNAFDKGRIQYYLGNYEQAQLLLDEAKSGGGPEVYLYLGMSYEATGDYNYAITNVYTNYLNKNEGDAKIYNQLGLCYMKQDDYDAAMTAFHGAMQIPDNGIMQTLQFNEIIAYEYMGEYMQASVLLDNYLKTYPDDVQAQREFGFLSTR